jgi:hypothetical protein
MPRRRTNGDERRRRLVAQEAARIIVNHGMRDYRAAKLKAAERLGFATRGSLPGNPEIERAVGEHLQLFGRESHEDLLRSLRRTALSAMRLLEAFTPRLVGPVLTGTADAHSAVNLHVFADSPEAVVLALSDAGFAVRPFERRLQSRRGRTETYAGFEFEHEHTAVQATVFPVDGIRQAPISPIDRKPMRRADEKTVRELLGEE